MGVLSSIPVPTLRLMNPGSLGPGCSDLFSAPQPPASTTASDPLDALGSEGALSPGGVVSLLRLPRGCGEQTMVYLAPTLAASRYLDKTEQWSSLPPETKDHAVDLIQKGLGSRGKAGGGGKRAVQGAKKGEGKKGQWAWRVRAQTQAAAEWGDWGGGGRGPLSSRPASCRLHEDPAVSEDRWFLWGLATP